MSNPAIRGVRFRASAFRLELQRGPQSDEVDAFEHYREGEPLVPGRWPAWQDWLNRVAEMTRQCTVTRVILLDTPPCEYQQWRIWAAPWHRRAGEVILFMPAGEAADLGIPTGNWWLLDDTLVTDDGSVITGRTAHRYSRYRDLVLKHAAQAIPA